MQQEKMFDFIVIGSGIAGLNAALTLSHFGNVLIVTKKKLHDSSTYHAQGGIAAVTKKDDAIDSHINDTLTAGYQHNKKEAVSLLVNGGTKAISRLIALGVPFDKQENGDFITSYEAAHSYPRIFHATDFTGREIEKVLITQVEKNQAIEIWEDSAAVDLIVKDTQCFGVQVVNKNKLVNVFSRAVILATGGTGQLYQWTTNPSVSTGEGIALAYRAGAEICDMEFVQFHPTALKENASPLLLLSEALRGEGAVLINSNGKRFMPDYHPLAELAPRDVVARAIFQEQRNGDVWIDISHKKKSVILKRFPNIARELKNRGFDLTQEPIPVTPAAHFMCGGIATDLYGRTSITNLFAYGEVAATGVHGANRLASNSLLEGMVFSEQIKHCIDELPKKVQVIKYSKKNLVSYSQSLVTKKLKNEIKTIMWQYAGIVRTKQGLQTAKKKLELLQKELEQINGTTREILETANMITVGLLITNAALSRQESLGAHYLQ